MNAAETRPIVVVHVVGARPNFMKVAPTMREMSRDPSRFQQVLVHTGQHYDDNMSGLFFEELALPRPDVYLGVGSGTHAQQTARVMTSFEPVLLDQRPDWVFVVGDVNSTLACALTAAKMGVKVAHVEAGLRSFDRTMPEEYNRVLTDHVADLLLTHSRDASENLLREGVSAESVHFVGNVMIDTLVRLLPKASERWRSESLLRLNVNRSDPYLLVTLHRPSNVDNMDTLQRILAALREVAGDLPIIFPVHPRTRGKLAEYGLQDAISEDRRLRLTEPLGYLDFLALERDAALVLTDSGGVQEETTYLGVPCLTVRSNTERPITITHGTNRLVAEDPDTLIEVIRETLSDDSGLNTAHEPPELWDGRAAERIAEVMRRSMSSTGVPSSGAGTF